MKDLDIRNARQEDQDAILDVTLSAYQEYATIAPQHWEGYRQNILATLAESNSNEQLVAQQNEAIVGTVLLYPGRPPSSTSGEPAPALEWPTMRLLAVAPVARGQGIGTALVRECMRRTLSAGHETLTLHTTDMMQTAMRMYERMGFVRAPELDFHPVEEVTVKGYRLNLNDAAGEIAGSQ